MIPAIAPVLSAARAGVGVGVGGSEGEGAIALPAPAPERLGALASSNDHLLTTAQSTSSHDRVPAPRFSRRRVCEPLPRPPAAYYKSISQAPSGEDGDEGVPAVCSSTGWTAHTSR
jgi:hypothetical protein